MNIHHDDIRATRCNFRPQQGYGQCIEPASFIDAEGSVEQPWTRLRCERHRKVDARTARNRGWGGREYVAFDRRARLVVLHERRQDREHIARLQRNHREAVEALKVLARVKALPEADQRSVERMLRTMTGE